MPTLYNLALSTHKKGFGKPCVRATADFLGVAGHFCAETCDIVRPDMAAIRECLPHYYRAAFDRAGSFWFPRDGNAAAYMTLRDSRGKYLNTLYATPYTFKPAPVMFDYVCSNKIVWGTTHTD